MQLPFSKSTKLVFDMQGVWNSPNTYPLHPMLGFPYYNLAQHLRGHIILSIWECAPNACEASPVYPAKTYYIADCYLGTKTRNAN